MVFVEIPLLEFSLQYGLRLVKGALLNSTQLQTALYSVRNVLWDRVLVEIDILSADHYLTAQGGSQDLASEVQECLDGLLHSGIRVGEGGYERGVGASGVELHVHGALRIYGHLVLGQGVVDRADFVFESHLRDERPFGDDVVFAGTRVRVRSHDSTRVNATDGDLGKT